jgi:tetratricopeptide (TPR) repeat protein
MLARQRGDLRQALELLEDAMERAQRLRETRIAGDIAMAIAWVNVGLGDLDSSRELFAHTLAECRDEGELYGACSAAHGLATVDLQQGRIGDAREGFVSTFREARDLRAKDYLARALHGIAAVEAIEGRSDVALRLLGLADRLFRESGRQLHDSIAYEIATAKLDSKIPETLRTKLRQEGEGIDVRDALDALSAGGLVEQRS